ncbi:MAG: DEAD/DEAH box helicase [Corynebacterium sp.]|nr:DEAD/DEAH box helicase [Corynebacterium sp.]
MDRNEAFLESFAQRAEDYILHGFWSADLGLALWFERVNGHKIVIPSMLPEDAFPPVIMDFLASLQHPRNYTVQLLTTKGRPVSLKMPVFPLTPERAADLLYALYILQDPTYVSHRRESGQSQLRRDAREFRQVVERTAARQEQVAVVNQAAQEYSAEEMLGDEGIAIDQQQQDVTPGQTWGIGRDLCWLARFRAGLGTFVRAGNVGITLRQFEREWYPVWKLQMGLAEDTWLREMMNACPQVLLSNFGGHLGEALNVELTPWIVNANLHRIHEIPRAYGWQGFVRSLLHGTAFGQGSARMVRALSQWNSSVRAEGLQLIVKFECVSDSYANEISLASLESLEEYSLKAVPLRSDAQVSEFPAIDFDDAFETDSSLVEVKERPEDEQLAPDDRKVHQMADSSQALWVARVQMYADSVGVQPIRLSELSSNIRNDLDNRHTRLLDAAPVLDPNRMVDSGDFLLSAQVQTMIDFDRQSSEAGEWDAYLSTAELAQLLVDADNISKAQGVRFVIPQDWRDNRVKVKLKVDPPQIRDAILGFDTLFDFSVEAAVGEHALSSAEMRTLLESSSSLVRFRNQWIFADPTMLHNAGKLLEKLESRAQQHLEEQADQLQLLQDQLDDEDGAAELLSGQHDALVTAAEDNQVTSLGFLRELSLESGDLLEVQIPGWQQSLIGGQDQSDPSEIHLEMPDSLHAELRDYQQRGVQWLYWMGQRGIGAILADDMGLGKTLQIIALEVYEREHRHEDARKAPLPQLPTLVVCPTSLMLNWKQEIAKFAPHLRTVIHHGPQRLKGCEARKQFGEADIIITSYGMVVSDVELIRSFFFKRIVVDEAQKLKNAHTKVNWNMGRLVTHHRVALSGTPVENHLLELHSLMDFCNKGSLGSRKFFCAHFAIPIEKYNDEDALARLRTFVNPFILRRSKQDPAIQNSLPEKQEMVVPVPLTPEQATLYKAYNDEVLRKIAKSEESLHSLIFKALTSYKQICNHPANFLKDDSAVVIENTHRSGKVAAATALIETALAQGEKVLIFTQFVQFARILQRYFETKFRTEVPIFYGDLSPQKRAELVARFQEDAGTKIMILTLGSGGVGLNLTAANVVIHMDRWWNPAVENQATDRAYRIGQDKQVRVYKMVSQGTIEERIDELISRKQELAAEVISGGESWLNQLSREELRDLLSFNTDGDGELARLREDTDA